MCPRDVAVSGQWLLQILLRKNRLFISCYDFRNTLIRKIRVSELACHWEPGEVCRKTEMRSAQQERVRKDKAVDDYNGRMDGLIFFQFVVPSIVYEYCSDIQPHLRVKETRYDFTQSS